MKKLYYVPVLGGLLAAAGVLAVALLTPYLPTQAELAPEETARLAEWSKTGDALGVQHMLEQGACVEAVSADGTSALMTAAAKGHPEVVKVLLMHNARVNAANAAGNTALHFAVQQDDPELVILLLQNEASVNARNKKGVTPLMLAAECGNDRIVQHLLVAGADVTLVDDAGENAAAYARKVQDAVVRSVILKLFGA